jgi:HSP20 family protein
MALPILSRGNPLAAFGESGDPFGSFDRGIDRLFENLWRGTGAPAAAVPGGFTPRIDVVEREAEYVVSAELPGLEEKDVRVEVHGDVLTLHGEKRSEHADEGSGWRWAERSYGAFRRAIRLPVEVEGDKASASFKNGVLTVTLPKASSARVRHIPVTAA